MSKYTLSRIYIMYVPPHLSYLLYFFCSVPLSDLKSGDTHRGHSSPLPNTVHAFRLISAIVTVTNQGLGQ